ncbi:MAG: Hsp70 family protein [Nannocystaceae bacterium]
MSERPIYVGIDLGTTNSAVAVFDGETTQVIRNAQGATLTPSVVRIDAKGRVTVGAAARRWLERDADNTKSEFKRLMGTERALSFPASGHSATPPELSAKVLASLRQDVADQLGIMPATAVISVPALFELPQSAATAEAAKLAGFDRVELLQEPIASALAAGWSARDGDGRWLVYDLGGGTFDASLLETHEGFLRVVGHDGDNFLGGRDFDWAVVDWAIAEIAREHGVAIRRDDPSHARAVSLLKHAAEEAKVALSRTDEVVLSFAGPLELPEQVAIEPELALDRATLERCIAPLVERTLDVSRRLLRSHDTEPEQLARIRVRRRPHGHAAAAATGGRACTRPSPGALRSDDAGGPGRGDLRRDLGPGRASGRTAGAPRRAAVAAVPGGVVGSHAARGRSRARGRRRPAAASGRARARRRRLAQRLARARRRACVRDHGRAASAPRQRVRAHRRRRRRQRRAGRAAQPHHRAGPDHQRPAAVAPPSAWRWPAIACEAYFEPRHAAAGAPPSTHTTIESVAKGSSESVRKIPIVQGEHDHAHLCRLVGTLEIPGSAIARSLPAGSDVELTIELDRGGRLAARAQCRRSTRLRARRAAAGARGRSRCSRPASARCAGGSTTCARRRSAAACRSW